MERCWIRTDNAVGRLGLQGELYSESLEAAAGGMV